MDYCSQCWIYNILLGRRLSRGRWWDLLPFCQSLLHRSARPIAHVFFFTYLHKSLLETVEPHTHSNTERALKILTTFIWDSMDSNFSCSSFFSSLPCFSARAAAPCTNPVLHFFIFLAAKEALYAIIYYATRKIFTWPDVTAFTCLSHLYWFNRHQLLLKKLRPQEITPIFHFLPQFLTKFKVREIDSIELWQMTMQW